MGMYTVYRVFHKAGQYKLLNVLQKSVNTITVYFLVSLFRGLSAGENLATGWVETTLFSNCVFPLFPET